MISLYDDVSYEMLEDPQQLLDNYSKLIECIFGLMEVVEQQIGYGKNEKKKYVERLRKRKMLISRMLQAQEEEIRLFDSCIALCNEKINSGDDIDGTYKKKKRSLERMKKDDKKMILQLQMGIRGYKKNISEIEKLINETEE